MAESLSLNDEATSSYFTSDDGTVKVPSVFMGNHKCLARAMEIKRDIDEYKWKDGDFLLASYPKNGTHFMWEVMMMLLRGSADYIKDTKALCMIDLIPISKSKTFFPSPRVVNTHYRLDVLPEEFRGRKTVLVIRNPKDTAVSLFHHEDIIVKNSECEGLIDSADTTFFEFAKQFLTSKMFPYGSYFDYTEYMWSLRDDPNMLVVYFEDLKMETVATVQKVNEFMGTSRSPELVEDISNAVEFSKMKKGKARSYINAGRMMNTMDDAEDKDDMMIDKAKKLYRRGEIGDWKYHLTVAENEMFDGFLDQWAVSKEIPFQY